MSEKPRTIKILSVFGTRPESIKMAPLIAELAACPLVSSKVCATAQHRQMLDQALEVFKISPDYDLDVMRERQTLTGITSAVLSGLSGLFAREAFDLCLVHGDTTTTMAAALAAFYAGVAVGHVEAGLRTYDLREPFPEEANRRVAGVLAGLHFAPTAAARRNLLAERVPAENIFVTGNTAIDGIKNTVRADYSFSDETLRTLDFSRKIITMTAHRRENLGEPLRNICRAARRIAEVNPDVTIVYAVHLNPAVRETAREILGDCPRVRLVPPLDILDMHNLMSRSFFIMTDSGGIQEEAPSMGVPVLVLRNVTERPEGLEAGTLVMGGVSEASVYGAAARLLTDREHYGKIKNARNPFGDGKASERILRAILHHFGLSKERPADYGG
ncbi:MAG: UDP-N-acetylglucosamine 2-epimerase (non-hydrolyzing) [Clostridiales bacterium]|jgi:UDP-N-acetylglucosamine 2-epimerase (non-hydrolysing)|nr:UDP-N-acetylglucosamine 2-epimerase (non-hydrolyzing) [Clostridiales bacterium]